MRKHEQPSVDVNLLKELGYETRDISLDVIVKWAIGLFVFVISTALITYGIYELFVVSEPSQNLQTPTARVQRLPPAPNPIIQPVPKRDIKNFRAQEDARVEHYGRNPKTGEIQIPVERAMQLTLERGLPTRAQAPAESGESAARQ